MLKKSVTPSTVLTSAARRALHRHGRDSLSDLRFLEQWATNPSYNAATILRAGQIRRTNPDLMQDIDTGIRQGGTRKALR